MVVTMKITVCWDLKLFSQSVLDEPAATNIPPSTLQMEAADSFKTLVTSYQIKWSCIPRDSNVQMYIYVVFSIKMYCHMITLMGITCIIPFVF
jgi:hypothetical protein